MIMKSSFDYMISEQQQEEAVEGITIHSLLSLQSTQELYRRIS